MPRALKRAAVFRPRGLKTAAPSRLRRRGGVYVAVLGVALLVTLIGVSAMLALRVEQRAAATTEAAVQARAGAASLIDLAQFWIAANPNWRTAYSNDTWTTPLTVDGVTYSLKLVDELDGDLANDPTQLVRLYAKAVAGDATRMESVSLKPIIMPNLLLNPDMENGATNWFAMTNCSIAISTVGPHGGTKCLLIQNRWVSFTGPGQDITSVLKNGVAYDVQAWVRMTWGSDAVTPVIETNGSGSGTNWFLGAGTSVGTTWTKVTGTITPTWSGTLNLAHFHIVTSSTLNDYKVDDALLAEHPTGPVVIPISGTWRQEVLP